MGTSNEERVVAAAREYARGILAPDAPLLVAATGTPVIRWDECESWMVRVESVNRRLIFVEVVLGPDGVVETRRFRA